MEPAGTVTDSRIWKRPTPQRGQANKCPQRENKVRSKIVVRPCATRERPETPAATNPRSILFVCTTDTCCGPMAAALFKWRTPLGNGRIVRSAGVSGQDGRSIHSTAQDVLYKRGIDPGGHRARMATPNLLEAFDLVLCMENRHREWVVEKAPMAGRRTFLLGQWRKLEIPEPVDGSTAEYEHVADKIEWCLREWSLYIEER